MKNNVQMYSKKYFSNNLKTLINNSGYDVKEIPKRLKDIFGISISEKQLYKYINEIAIPKADKLYLLADLFGVSIDGLIGRFELSEYYIEKDDPNFNKFHLDSNSRYKLSNIESETEINVLNNIISKSNLLEIFVSQLENAAAQLETAKDKESKETIIFIASCLMQREIDKVFRNCLSQYRKNNVP